MYQSTIIIIICFAMTLLAAGCGELDCPAYPEKYLNWIPYKQGDILFFTDGKDTIKFIVNDTFNSTAYTTHHAWPLDQSCIVEARVNIRGDTLDPLNRAIRESSYLNLEDQNFRDYSISISSQEIYFEYSTFEFYMHNSEKPANLLSCYDNGYKIYSNVVKLEIDTIILPQRINMVYFAESTGIIQFKDHISHKTWSLIRN